MNIVLLTATVQPPPNAKNLARADPKVRMQDYLEAFAFYLSQLRAGVIDGIVFCDNSDANLDELRTMAAGQGLQDRVEVMGFRGLDYPAGYGRGFGEFKLVDHAMVNSSLIGSTNDAIIWKITGRYKLLNLAQLLASRPPGADLYCHCRNIPNRWLDLYVLAWNRTGYAGVIQGAFEGLREDSSSRSAEQLFRDLMDVGRSVAHIVRRFGVVPKLEGRRGYDNGNYLDMRFKLGLRVLANKIVPWLWI
jgi:hypothetical protein